MGVVANIRQSGAVAEIETWRGHGPKEWTDIDGAVGTINVPELGTFAVSEIGQLYQQQPGTPPKWMSVDEAGMACSGSDTPLWREFERIATLATAVSVFLRGRRRA